ncbi:MAG: hypothetical protein WC848_06335 [Parcubacteria group bacterium]|jgi:hypothetical protein
MQKSKQILILIFALIVLISGIYSVARKISEKNKSAVSMTERTSKTEQDEQRKKILDRQVPDANNPDLAGTIVNIKEKTMLIKGVNETVLVNISGATPVTLIDKNKKETLAGMADLERGDAVKITYDKDKNVTMIYLEQ